MTVKELYSLLEEKFPAALSAEWDNDGLMCCPDPDAPVRRVLCTLDVTEAAVDHAIRVGADLILSHHPLLFHPLSSLTADTAVGRKLMALLREGISVLSFHTRADAAEGGVNDTLAGLLGLLDILPFAEGMGRIGRLPSPRSLEEFAATVVSSLGAPAVALGDAGLPVSRVAVLGGSGKGEVAAAVAAGADTFLSGRLSYEAVNEAKELGINLLEAGHFYTEAPLMRRLTEELREYGLLTEYFDSCSVRVIGR